MPRFSLRTLLLTVFWLALPLGLIGFLIQNVPRWQAEHARQEAEYERQQAADIKDGQQLIADIDAIHTKLGRYPTDEAELVELRGKPMPATHPKNKSSHPIAYTRDSGQPKFGLHFWY
jgi:hypothetical protein